MCWHVANQVDELVLETDGRRGKVLAVFVTHGGTEQNQNCCEWPTNNLRTR
jgi:hypothetical protein